MMIEIQELGKHYQDYTALAGVTLSVAAGEVVGLLGPLGSGKSTLIKILATLIEPTRGAATICGHSVTREREAVRACIGYSPNYFASYEDMLTGEYLEFFAQAYGLNPEDPASRLDELLALAGLEEWREKPVDSLDREQRRRLSLVKTLLGDPPVLLLDEPAVGLAPAERRRIRELTGRLQRPGRAILVSSNVLSDLVGLCHRICVLHQGRVLATDKATTLARRLSNHRVIEADVRGEVERACRVAHKLKPVGQAGEHQGHLVFTMEGTAEFPGEAIETLRREGVPVAAWRELEVDVEGFAETLPWK